MKSARVWLAALMTAGLSVYLISSRGPSSPPPLALLLLAVPSLALEMLAVRQKEFGFFSAAFATNFSASLYPATGPQVAAFLILAGLGLRTLSRGANRWSLRVREFFSDALPQLATVAFVKAFPTPVHFDLQAGLSAMLGSLCVYLPMSILLPGWLVEDEAAVDLREWQKIRVLTAPLYFGLGFLGICEAYLMGLDYRYAVFVVPILVALQRGSQTEQIRLDSIDKKLLQARQEQSRLELALTQARLRDVTQAGETMGHLSVNLFASSDLDATYQVLLNGLKAVVSCRSAAVLTVDEEGLKLRMVDSPDATLFARHRLEDWQHDWQRGVPSQKPWIPSEPVAARIPTPTGLLYVGRPAGQPFSPAELERLSMFSRQASAGIASARKQSAQREDLEQQSEVNRDLRMWVDRLVYLLDGTRALAASVDAQSLLERFQQIVESLVPHRAGLVLRENERGRRWPDDFCARPADLAAHVLATGRWGCFELELPGTFWKGVLAAPLGDEEGKLGSVILLAERATDFHPDHERILQLVSYQLASALRGAKLQQELQDAQAHMVQTSKMAAIGQLAAGIAHEINNPLASVFMGLDGLEAGLGDAERTQKRLSKIRRALERARDIVAKLLSYSRDTASNDTDFDLNHLVHDTFELFRQQVEVGGVTLSLQLQDPLPPCWGSPNEIQQVLLNLLLNARDALGQSPEKGIVVQTGSRGEEVCLRVVDRGSGMDAATLERIFEPFFTTKAVGEGTGLGLAVSRQLMEKNRGTLVASSVLGKGAVFTLSLPRSSGSEKGVA